MGLRWSDVWSLLSMVTLGIAIASAGTAVVEECDRRWYDYSSCVCACNAARCDIPEPIQLSPGVYVTYMSSMQGARLQRSTGYLSHPSAASSDPAGVASLLVNSSDLNQQIIGFGGAMTDSTAINIATLSAGAQRQLLRAYFSPEGSQYSIVRVPIAGADFSTHYYSYDDVANDTQLRHFNLTAEDLQLKIPYLQEASTMSSSSVKILASAWTAPSWMKMSEKRLHPDNYQLWADYILRFVEEYSAQGLKPWALTGQNEPVLGAEDFITFNSMTWTAAEQATWLSRHLATTLQHAGHSDITLLALDDQRPFMELWANTMFGNSTVSKYVSGLAVHWYYDRSSDPDIITRVHKLYPDKLLLYTEACDGPFMSAGPAVQLGSWERAENYTSNIIQVLSRGVAGWLDWNLVLDGHGGPNWVHNYVDAAVIVNASADEFYKQPMYYALAHFSRYVTPGSRRVDVRASGRSSLLEHVAFVTSLDHTVLVLQNRNDEDLQTEITDVKAGFIKTTIPARSIHTIIYKG